MNTWLPQNLASTCTNGANITTCQPSTFMFLQMITSLFSRSRDAPPMYTFPSILGPKFVDLGIYANSAGSVPRPNSLINEFDFIVIGAGTAGCVTANRLTEVPEWNVLLLEAGEEEPDVTSVPGLTSPLRRSSIDWSFMTQPQPNSCTARPGGQCIWPRGRVMGGTSAINLMIYLRGGPKDYDTWAELGNPGWSYKDVFPYFLRMERNLNPQKVDPHYHGTRGDWPVEFFPYQDQNIYLTIQALQEYGLDVFDQNTERQVGASLMQHSTRDGQRVSANVAFIRPIRNIRSNLVVQSGSFVTKILINPKTKTAYGVEYQQNGKMRVAIARKEVILSAGVMGSPKALMLSGVGPADHLEEMHINVIKDLKVGYNLHDHTTIDGIVIALSNKTATTASTEQVQQDLTQYMRTRRGPFSGTSMLQVNAFLQTKYETGEDTPDIQFSFDPTDVSNYYTDPILTSLSNVLPTAYYDGLAIRPVLLSPKSRGIITLNKTHPVFGPPLIFANTFDDPIDMMRIIDGVRHAVNLASTKTFQKIGARLVTTPMPACTHYEFNTEEYWMCCAVAYTTTLYHPVGTCKMGPESDHMAVVNHELKVYGIKNLRVIDGSIMPVVVRANTNTATLMIAEKGCDMIKEDWLKNRKISPKNYNLNKHGFIKDFFKGFLKDIFKKK